MKYEHTLHALQSRYAVKKFDPTHTLTQDELTLIEETLRLSPSSFGLEPWKFVVLTNKDVQAKLYPHAMKNTQVRDASVLVVLCVKNELTKADIHSYIRHVAQVRGVTEESLAGFKKMLLGFRFGKTMNKIFFGLPRRIMSLSSLDRSWAENQVFIALGFLLTVAAEHGIDACPMGGFHQRGIKKVLAQYTNLDGYTPSVLCALGKHADDDSFAIMKKVRKEKNDVIVRI